MYENLEVLQGLVGGFTAVLAVETDRLEVSAICPPVRPITSSYNRYMQARSRDKHNVSNTRIVIKYAPELSNIAKFASTEINEGALTIDG